MSTALAKRASPSRHVYDVVVIGGQLGGALCAGVLAKRGYQVLLVEHDGLGTPYVHGDYAFHHAPFLTGALDKIGPLEVLLVELGLATQLKRASHATALQLLRPRQWFELFPELGARSKELSRALGDEAAETFIEQLDKAHKTLVHSEPFFSSGPDLPPEGWFSRWKAQRHLAKYAGLDTDTTLTTSSPLEAMVRSLDRFVATAEGPLVRARELARLLPAPHVFPDGGEGFRATLVERSRELGADALDGVQIDEIVFRGNTAVGVRLPKSDTVYRASAVVAACDLTALAPILPQERQRPLEKLRLLVPFSRALFTTHSVLPEQALPRGLGAIGLVETTDGELGPVFVSVVPARKNGVETGERVLSLTVRVPMAVRSAGDPAVRALTARIWKAVHDVFPFTQSHVVLTSAPWLDSPRVAARVSEPWPTFDLTEHSALGIAGLGTHTPWAKVFNASRQVLPGLGLEGEALAASRTIAAVERALNKKTSLRAGRPS